MTISDQTRQLSAEQIADPETFKRKICDAIRRSQGNVSEAAEYLGVSRRTLHRYLADTEVLCNVLEEERLKSDDRRLRRNKL